MNSRPTNLLWFRVATTVAILYWVTLVTLTHVPKLPTVPMAPGDKTAHYVAYALLALLLSWVWATRWPYFPRGAVVVVVVAMVYGAIDELTQIPIPGRFGEWYDWYADSLGALTGAALFLAIVTLWRWLRGPADSDTSLPGPS